MTPQELKASILQLAVQGKLVEPLPPDELLEELKNKALPKDRDDIPFDVPDTWSWCYLEDIATLYNGRAYKKPEMLAKGKYPLLRVGNLFTSDIWYYSDLELEPEKYCDDGDLLYAWSASFGPHIWSGGKVIYHYHIWKVELRYPQMRDYLYWVLAAQTESIKRSGHGSTMIHITKAGTEKMLIPLPPLAEQKRIVAKIEELLPLIDRYEKAWSKLEDFNKRFPVDMQKSILQMAIQGKLVEQRPEEGTGEELYQQIQTEKQRLIKAGTIKKEKPLAEIAEDEIPFDIPDTWKWVRLSEIISVLGDGIHGTPVFDEMGEYYFVNGNNLAKGHIVFKADTKKVSFYEYEKYKKPLDENTILISINGTIGNYAFYAGEPIILGKSACYFSVLTGVDKEYVRHLINTKFFMDYAVKEATQTTIKNVSLKAMRMLPVPLPPLAEQKRIVARLEEILPLCDRLK